MYTCIILHNIIIEDVRNATINWSDDEEDPLAQIISKLYQRVSKIYADKSRI